jgi:hypothetical protein
MANPDRAPHVVGREDGRADAFDHHNAPHPTSDAGRQAAVLARLQLFARLTLNAGSTPATSQLDWLISITAMIGGMTQDGDQSPRSRPLNS